MSQVAAATILTLHPLRSRPAAASIACVLAIVGVWISRRGRGSSSRASCRRRSVRCPYTPSRGEVFVVSPGIWALGMLVFTLLAKVAIPIEVGALRSRIGARAG